jgi:hypothetical protein
MATTFSLPVSRVTIGDWDMIRSSWPYTGSVRGLAFLWKWRFSTCSLVSFLSQNQQETGSDSPWFHGQLHRKNKEKDSKTDRDFGGVEERRMQRRRFHSRAHSLAPSLKMKEFLEEGKKG